MIIPVPIVLHVVQLATADAVSRQIALNISSATSIKRAKIRNMAGMPPESD